MRRYCLILLYYITSGVVALAATSNVPAGFEKLASGNYDDFTTFTYQGKPIGFFEITNNQKQGAIIFKNPDELFLALNKIRPMSNQLLQILKKPLKIYTKAPISIQTLHTLGSFVLAESTNMNLVISPKLYLEKSGKTNVNNLSYYPHLSFLGDFNLSTANYIDIVDINNNFATKRIRANTLNLDFNNYINYANNSLQFGGVLSKSLDNTNAKLTFDDLFYVHYLTQESFSVGYMDSAPYLQHLYYGGSFSFLQNSSFVGVDFGSFKIQTNMGSQMTKTLQVYVSFPNSRIEIIQDNTKKIIYKNIINIPGIHNISYRTLPKGYYTITINTYNNNTLISTDHQTITNFSNMTIQDGEFLYFVQAGIAPQISSSDPAIYTKVLDIYPKFNTLRRQDLFTTVGIRTRLNPFDFAVITQYQEDTQIVNFSSALSGYRVFTVEGDAGVSNHGVGVSGTLGTGYKFASFSVSALRSLPYKKYNQSEIDNTDNTQHDPLYTDEINYSGNMSFAVLFSSLSIGASHSNIKEYKDNIPSNTYENELFASLGFAIPIEKIRPYLLFSASMSNKDTTASVSLSFSMDRVSISASQGIYHNASTSLSTSYSGENWQTSLSANKKDVLHDPDTAFTLNSIYNGNQYIRGNGDITYNTKYKDRTNYNLSIGTTVGISGGLFAINGKNMSEANLIDLSKAKNFAVEIKHNSQKINIPLNTTTALIPINQTFSPIIFDITPQGNTLFDANTAVAKFVYIPGTVTHMYYDPGSYSDVIIIGFLVDANNKPIDGAIVNTTNKSFNIEGGNMQIEISSLETRFPVTKDGKILCVLNIPNIPSGMLLMNTVMCGSASSLSFDVEPQNANEDTGIYIAIPITNLLKKVNKVIPLPKKAKKPVPKFEIPTPAPVKNKPPIKTQPKPTTVPDLNTSDWDRYFKGMPKETR